MRREDLREGGGIDLIDGTPTMNVPAANMSQETREAGSGPLFCCLCSMRSAREPRAQISLAA
jgi:hypothetical protein